MQRKRFNFFRSRTEQTPLKKQTIIKASDHDGMEERALQRLKDALIADCKFPESLQCSILQDVPAELVVTPQGHLYNKASIITWIDKNHTCPFTRAPLYTQELQENQTLDSLLSTIKILHAAMINAIHLMTIEDKSAIYEQLAYYKEQVAITNQLANDELSLVRQQTLIKGLVDQLKLDIHNTNHLEYWETHSSPRYDKRIEVAADDADQIYRIPKLIHEFMLIALEHHPTKAAFKAAIDQRRRQDRGVPRFFEKPYANIVGTFFRPPAPAVISDAADIEYLHLNP